MTAIIPYRIDTANTCTAITKWTCSRIYLVRAP
jgi:hypothetical protein